VVREGCYPLALYMKHARRVKVMYGVKNIFLATDSARVIAQTTRIKDFNFIYQKFSRAHFEIPRILPGKIPPHPPR
jgi:hypothetical protein